MTDDLNELLDRIGITLNGNASDVPFLSGGDFSGFRRKIERMTDLLISAMFPMFADEPSPLALEERKVCYLREASELMQEGLEKVLAPEADTRSVLIRFLEKIPEVKRQLQKDLLAAYQGDPAARSAEEIILSYPAFPAISAYRIAHILYLERVPLIPRMMTEYAHRNTGIDIHPGASIGSYFFIDHGTGVVIGETTTIGEHVKLYQHVTLGAKSFDVKEDGSLVKGIKRHPDIGDHVVIYAGATILGGNTKIGAHSVIGGNVWLTHSVAAGKTVLAQSEVMGNALLRDNTPYSVRDEADQQSLLSAML